MSLFLDHGGPRFPQIIHVNQPNIASREKFMSFVNDILDSRWLTNDGPYVRQLEQLVAAHHDVRHCVAVCNGTIALQLAIRALDLKGEVILPSFTFVATAHALEWQGITPVFCDVDPDTLTMDPHRAEELISDRTSALLPVHLFSNACDTEAIENLARRRNLQVLYDAAHCFGSSFQGRKFGGFGHAEIFSFHATKIFNTFEGGAVLTDDDELASRLRLMRNFGFTGYDRVDHIGTNAKLAEIPAAQGCALMDDVPGLILHNMENRSIYLNELSSIPGITLFPFRPGLESNGQYAVIFVDEARFGLSRDLLYDALWEENVRARRYFSPGCHRMEPYASSARFRKGDLSVTESRLAEILCLPTGSAVSASTAREISALIREYHERAIEVAAWYRHRPESR
ncbi:MAG: DegT/DnrJ/EryC1/StrS family aminotransferase [Candidatus Hydrogenedentota bacterium]